MKLKELKEKRGDVVRSLNSLAELVSKENRAFTEDEKAQYDNLDVEQRSLKDQIETLERIESAKALVTPEAKEHASYRPSVVSSEDKDLAVRAWGLRKGNASHKINSDMRRAVERVGLDLDAPAIELRAQTVGTASEGGYLTNTNIFSGLVEARKTYGGVRSVASVVPVETGETRSWATYDGTSNKASIVGENTTISNQSRTFGTLPIAIYKMATATYPVSHEVLQDAGVDLGSFLNRNLFTEVVRGQEYYWTLGSGTSQPHGVVAGATSAFTAADDVNVTSDELQDLIDSLDVSYSSAGVFMMNQTMWSRIRKLKDGVDRYMFLNDAINGRARTLFGYPVILNNFMEHAATKKSIIFGDIKGYFCVEAGSVTLATQEYPLDDYTAFVAKVRCGGRTLDTGAFKCITMAAS